MSGPEQDWRPEDRHQPTPMFTPSGFETSDINGVTKHEGQRSSFGRNVPRAVYGNTSRFGMIKGSIAARKASAASAATAANARMLQAATDANGAKQSPTVSPSKPSLLAKRERATTSLAERATTSPAVDHPAAASGAQEERVERNGVVGFEENDGNRSPGDTAVSFKDTRKGEGSKEEEEAKLLLGPMGSFYELPKVSSAADLIRTAAHDQSSNSVSQARGLRQANVPTAYSEVASTGYYRPSDRIGRLYTSTAAALTSTSAQSVAKAAAALAVAAGAPAGGVRGRGVGGGGSGGGVLGRADGTGGVSKLVTAPFAADSREILQTLALLPSSSRGTLSTSLPRGIVGEVRRGGNQSPSPTRGGAGTEAFGSPTSGENGAREGVGSPGSPSGLRKATVAIDSAQDHRTQLREMRSPPRGRRILDVAPSSGGAALSSCPDVPPRGDARTVPDGGGGYAVKDFRSWNPAVLDGAGGAHGSVDGVARGDAAAGGKRGGQQGGDQTNVMREAERQEDSIDRYWIAVEDRMLNGSPNALGAGAKSPLLELPPERVDGITSRLAFELRFIPGIELGAYQAYVEAAVNSMLQDVQIGHAVAVARAVVDYELKDPEGRRALGIERGHLLAGPRWYQSQEYLIPEWRVLRQTGVSRARVRRSALALKRKLCSVETIMVGLEKLWHSGVVPGDWDTASFGGSGDVVSFNERRARKKGCPGACGFRTFVAARSSTGEFRSAPEDVRRTHARASTCGIVGER